MRERPSSGGRGVGGLGSTGNLEKREVRKEKGEGLWRVE